MAQTLVDQYMINRNVYKLDKEAHKTHNEQTSTCCTRDRKEFFFVWFCAEEQRERGIHS